MGRYKGFGNYETWRVNSEINKNSDSATYWANEANQIVRDFGQDMATSILAEKLEEGVVEKSVPVYGELYLDLLLYALGNVDWDEIAESLIGRADGAMMQPFRQIEKGIRELERINKRISSFLSYWR